MRMIEIKWYSPFLFLVGAILSFADPITDILTLVEFYRADHKTWFGVGLMFVILPCLVFSFLHCHYMRENEKRRPEDFFCWGFHPFAPALVKLKAFIYCLKYFKVHLTPNIFFSPPKTPCAPDYNSEKIIIIRLVFDFL